MRQLFYYSIDLFKKIDYKELYILYIIKKLQQVKYINKIYFNRYYINFIYSNLFNKLSTSKENYKYYIIFINNYNKIIKVKYLRIKSEVFKVF